MRVSNESTRKIVSLNMLKNRYFSSYRNKIEDEGIDAAFSQVTDEICSKYRSDPELVGQLIIYIHRFYVDDSRRPFPSI